MAILNGKEIMLIGIKGGGDGSDITVDSELSNTSVNPVQNKVVTEALGGKLDKYNGDGATYFIYAVYPDGTQKMIPYSVGAIINSVVCRNEDGTFFVQEPINGGNPATKRFVENLIKTKVDATALDNKFVEHLDEFHKQSDKYENITIAGMYRSGYVSKTELPNPKKIRIESLDICKVFNEDVGGAQEYYGLATPQTFSITPDSNGYFSVDVNANVYKGWEYNEDFGEWMPSEDSTPIEENVPLTLNFKFSFEDVVGDGVNQSLIFCYNLNNELDDRCTVSLYIIPDESLVTYKDLDEKVGTIETALDEIIEIQNSLIGGVE